MESHLLQMRGLKRECPDAVSRALRLDAEACLA